LCVATGVRMFEASSPRRPAPVPTPYPDLLSLPRTRPMPMDRRQFLRVAATGAVVHLTSTACRSHADAASDAAALAQPELLALVGPEQVREIGRRYRRAVPAEHDAEALRAAILAASRASRLGEAPRVPVAELVRSDFAEGRTVVVHGWVLSVTEARQCALFSLLHA